MEITSVAFSFKLHDLSLFDITHVWVTKPKFDIPTVEMPNNKIYNVYKSMILNHRINSID